MDRLQEISQVLSLQSLTVVMLIAFAAYILTPGTLRLRSGLAVLVVISELGKFLDFGIISHFAKGLLPIAYVYVAVAAMTHPGPRREMSIYAWGYPFLAFVALFYLQNVLDFRLAVIFRAQWLIICVAAVMVGRTIVDQASLRNVLVGLGIGMALASSLTFSSLVMNPAIAFTWGYGRFSPFGTNPNQIGLLFALAVPITLYLSITAQSSGARAIYGVFFLIAAAQAVLTVSRASMGIALVPSLPILVRMTRQPLLVGLAILGLVFVAYYSALHGEDVSFDRLYAHGVHERMETASQMWSMIRENLLFGLLQARHAYAMVMQELNSHNAYLDLLYLGGLTLGLPHFLLFGMGHCRAIRAWLLRNHLPFDPVAMGLLTALSLSALAHGFINCTVLYPTYIWSFVNVLVAGFFLSLPFPVVIHRGLPPPIYGNSRGRIRTSTGPRLA